jgi:hypothetical protein
MVVCISSHVSAQVNPSTIITKQQAVKMVPRRQTLFEKMCFQAEDIVRYNWTDVAVHDRKILENTKPRERRLWIVTELGTMFPPMFCRTHEEHRCYQRGYTPMSAMEVLLMKMARGHGEKLPCETGTEAIKRSASYFIVCKGSDDWSGSIEPIDFCDIMALAFPA